jgi:hypothetical protein
MKYLGEALATIGICALIGFAIYVTGSLSPLWALLILLLIW